MSVVPASTIGPSTLQKIATRPRLGFLGVGWIGRNRMEAVAKDGSAEIAAIADPAVKQVEQVTPNFPRAATAKSLEELLALEVDGVVIATPSALHAAQAEMALNQGIPVFCQKPLGRNLVETERVISAAKRADRLLGVDLSYRHLSGTRKVRELCRSGALGHVYAVDVVFHNAYGPDKPWFYNPTLSGGGCVIDLGIHLIDLALWMLGSPKVSSVSSRLYRQGAPISPQLGAMKACEDYAEARLDTDTGASIRMSCSWRLHAGQDAVIKACFYGTDGGAAIYNVNGSFYEFAASHFKGTKNEIVASGAEDWGGRAILEWAQRLAVNGGFDKTIEPLCEVAAALDAIYHRAS